MRSYAVAYTVYPNEEYTNGDLCFMTVRIAEEHVYNNRDLRNRVIQGTVEDKIRWSHPDYWDYHIEYAKENKYAYNGFRWAEGITFVQDGHYGQTTGQQIVLDATFEEAHQCAMNWIADNHAAIESGLIAHTVTVAGKPSLLDDKELWLADNYHGPRLYVHIAIYVDKVRIYMNRDEGDVSYRVDVTCAIENFEV